MISLLASIAKSLGLYRKSIRERYPLSSQHCGLDVLILSDNFWEEQDFIQYVVKGKASSATTVQGTSESRFDSTMNKSFKLDKTGSYLLSGKLIPPLTNRWCKSEFLNTPPSLIRPSHPTLTYKNFQSASTNASSTILKKIIEVCRATIERIHQGNMLPIDCSNTVWEMPFLFKFFCHGQPVFFRVWQKLILLHKTFCCNLAYFWHKF